jgi:Uncharacterized conserved protein
MANIAKVGDNINSKTVSGHCYIVEYDENDNPYNSYYNCSISGKISNAGSNSKVYINGVLVATKGASTNESDDMHSNQSGTITTGSSKVFINGVPVARTGDIVNLHNGETTVISNTNSKVFINS